MASQPDARQPELVALTSLRGIAAIFVLSHHFMLVLLEKLARFIPSHLFVKSYLWVDLFFLLSGFVLAYVYHSRFVNGIAAKAYRNFMWARFARVYPVHIFMLSLFVAFELLQWWLLAIHSPGSEHLETPFTGSETPLTLASNLLLLQTLHWTSYWNQPAWSISAEWLVYFTVPWLIYRFYHQGKLVMIAAAAAVFIMLASIENHFGNLGLEFAGWPSLLRCFGECILGVIAFQCYRRGHWKKIASADWALPVLLFNFLLLALPLPGFLSVAGFFWLVLCAARIPQSGGYWLTWSPLVYLGRISFAIYMVHWLVMDLLRVGSLYFTGVAFRQHLGLLGEVGAFAAATLLSLCVAAVLYHCVEQPLRNWLLLRRE